MEKELIDAVIDYYDYDPNTDPASCYDYYESAHSDEYMFLADSNDSNNFIDYNKGTITVDGKTYDEPEMYLYKKGNHMYLSVNNQEILVATGADPEVFSGNVELLAAGQAVTDRIPRA